MKDINFPQEYRKITNDLYHQATRYIEEARLRVQRSINTEMVSAYWLIGRDIVEAEQKGQVRAAYGSNLIKELSQRLCDNYGKGFGVSTLRDIRQFYITYEDTSPIHHAVRGKSKSFRVGPLSHLNAH